MLLLLLVLVLLYKSRFLKSMSNTKFCFEFPYKISNLQKLPGNGYWRFYLILNITTICLDVPHKLCLCPVDSRISLQPTIHPSFGCTCALSFYTWIISTRCTYDFIFYMTIVRYSTNVFFMVWKSFAAFKFNESPQTGAWKETNIPFSVSSINT